LRKLTGQNMKIIKPGPAGFGAFNNNEIARWDPLIKTNNIVIN